MAKKLLVANCRPSLMFKRMTKHKGDVSEGTKYKIIARKQLLNKYLVFYSNGLRRIENIDLTEQEQYDSEILRLAHASVLIGESVGDKRMCYVDATKNPIEVWVYGMKLEEFIKVSKGLIDGNLLPIEFLLEEPLQSTMRLRNERNVKLFGGTVSTPHLQNG